MCDTGHTWLEAPAHVHTGAELEFRSGLCLPRPTPLYLLQWHLKNSFIELRSLSMGSANRTALAGAQSCARSLPPSRPVAPRGRTAGSCPEEEEEDEEGEQQGEMSSDRREGAAAGERAPAEGAAAAEGGGRSREGGRSGRPGAANSGDSSIFRRESGTSVG